ncbi:MAG: GntR family transcriptional regulator [Frankia sp.]
MFRLDPGSGVPIYRQLGQQVRQDVLLGRLRPGDQLPTVKEVVDLLAVNPNTVVKAYGELEHEGFVVRRQGVGTFVAAAPPATRLAAPPALLGSLTRWVRRARESGLSPEQMRALLTMVLDEPAADLGEAAGPAPGGVVAGGAVAGGLGPDGAVAGGAA